MKGGYGECEDPFVPVASAFTDVLSNKGGVEKAGNGQRTAGKFVFPTGSFGPEPIGPWTNGQEVLLVPAVWFTTGASYVRDASWLSDC